ncbi:MAG: hypothetical protein JXQ87_13010 [Bacteroidia bacterium]
MNINLSPRERILKEVRSSLVSVRDRNSATSQTAFAVKSIDEDKVIDELKKSIGEHSKLFSCYNKYHFLDQFILFTERSNIKNFVCNSKKLINYFNSCGLTYIDNSDYIDSNTVAVFMADYFEPNGLFASFNYNGFIAEALIKTQNLVIVCYKDSLVKNSKLLFERIRNRIGDSDLLSIQLLNIVESESLNEQAQKVSFILNSR